MLPLASAAPPWRETLLAVVIYPIAAFLLTAFVSLGIDKLFPDWLSDTDFAANRLRMALVFVPSVVGLAVWTRRVNKQHRYYRVFGDRFEVGSPARVVVPLEDITAIRVGAPMPATIRKVQRANEVLGAVSSKNRGAAAHLGHTYANTVVLTTAQGSLVIHLGTVNGAQDVFEALVAQCPDRLTPPVYEPEELARLGRFKAGWYPHSA